MNFWYLVSCRQYATWDKLVYHGKFVRQQEKRRSSGVSGLSFGEETDAVKECLFLCSVGQKIFNICQYKTNTARRALNNRHFCHPRITVFLEVYMFRCVANPVFSDFLPLLVLKKRFQENHLTPWILESLNPSLLVISTEGRNPCPECNEGH
jgi:hypothetical protein